MARIVQGDAYYIEFQILDEDKIVIPISMIDNVSITIGGLRKTYASAGADNDILYDSDRDVWQYPMSQSESLQWPTSVDVDVYVELIDGSVIGRRLPHIQVTPAQIKEAF